MKLTEDQIGFLASRKEIRVSLPDKFLNRKAFKSRYGLFNDTTSDCDCGAWQDDDGSPLDEPRRECDCEELFWNNDLRSVCGFFEDGYAYSGDIILHPEFYSKFCMYEFSRMMLDAEEIVFGAKVRFFGASGRTTFKIASETKNGQIRSFGFYPLDPMWGTELPRVMVRFDNLTPQDGTEV